MSVLAVRYGFKDRGKGTGEQTTETLLWSNPNTATSRSSLDATLSQSIKNFQRIRVEYAWNTSASSPAYHAVYPVYSSDGDYMFPAGRSKAKMAIAQYPSSGNLLARTFQVTNETTIHFNNASRLNASGTSATSLIPWYIYGINGGYGTGGSSGGASIPVYVGPYEVTPLAESAQTLATAGKQMVEDVTVAKIPYYETSNISGTTVYIAGEIE
jgi:hypothetical protein